MGLGEMFTGIFGGGNDFSSVLPPMMGLPKQEGETPEQYQARVMQSYQQQISPYQKMMQGYGAGDLKTNLLDQSAANKTLAQNQGLINQLIAQGKGQGPNPALEQLKQTTDSNIRQQAGMAASQRGINPALAARMAAQNAAGMNQSAAGQAALQSAQQQLAAQQAAGGLLGNQAGLQAQMALQQGQTGLGLLGANTAQQGMGAGALNAFQSMLGNQYANANNVNAGVAAQNAQTAGQYGQGLMGGISGALGGLLNKGGMAGCDEEPIKMADGGMFQNYLANMGSLGQKLGNKGGAWLKDLFAQDSSADFTKIGAAPTLGVDTSFGQTAPFKPTQFNLQDRFGSIEDKTGFMDRGQPFNSDPLSIPLAEQKSLSDALQLERKLGFNVANPFMSTGGKVDGKAKTKGDSKQNDTVPALLSPGEIVIPRTAAQDPMAAHDFLDKVLKKHKVKGYGDVLRSNKELEARKAKLDKMCSGGKV